MNKTYTCPCREGQHTLDTHFPVWAYVAQTIDTLGEYIDTVVIGENGEVVKYRVPRIYIAIHGIKGSEMHKYGFKRV